MLSKMLEVHDWATRSGATNPVKPAYVHPPSHMVSPRREQPVDEDGLKFAGPGYALMTRSGAMILPNHGSRQAIIDLLSSHVPQQSVSRLHYSVVGPVLRSKFVSLPNPHHGLLFRYVGGQEPCQSHFLW